MMFTSARAIVRGSVPEPSMSPGYRAVRASPRFSFGRRPGPVVSPLPPAQLFIPGISQEQAMDRQKRERRKGMLAMETIFVVGVAALTLFNFDRFALAQDDPQAAPPAAVQGAP